VNRFIERYRTGGASESQIEEGTDFGGREFAVEEEERM
jgi:hypothetical protein